MSDLIESGDLNLRHVINCEDIIKYHDKLIKKYKNIKKYTDADLRSRRMNERFPQC
mgnify:CR=1 FL=1